MHRRLLKFGLIATAAAATAAALLFTPLNTHWVSEPPGGGFSAVARTQPFRALVPVMPGGGSDRPGWITVYRGGQSCGTARLELVHMAYALRWALDERPRRAEIRLVASWNLDDCTMER